MDKTELAEYIARRVFQHKKDLNGEPYSDHLSRVAQKIKSRETAGQFMVQAAWLHDILEDFPEWNIKQIEDLFGSTVANLVDLLTKKPDQDYFNYIRRIISDYDAKVIKLADLEDNLNVLRYKSKPELDATDLRRIAKYHKAYWILTNENAKEVFQ